MLLLFLVAAVGTRADDRVDDARDPVAPAGTKQTPDAFIVEAPRAPRHDVLGVGGHPLAASFTRLVQVYFITGELKKRKRKKKGFQLRMSAP